MLCIGYVLTSVAIFDEYVCMHVAYVSKTEIVSSISIMKISTTNVTRRPKHYFEKCNITAVEIRGRRL